jgi:peptidyl-prolyl cis-trans isomerase-like 4
MLEFVRSDVIPFMTRSPPEIRMQTLEMTGFAEFMRTAYPPQNPKPIDPFAVPVAGFGHSMDEFFLKTAFSKFGPVENVFIMRDKVTRKSLGKGFVKFETREACQSCTDSPIIILDVYLVSVSPAYRRP